MTRRRPVSTGLAAAEARDRRHPSLAPRHLGEAASVATLAVAVFGVAVVITGVAMLVMGFTMNARYATTPPPPDLAELGLGTVLGGAGLLVLGMALVGAALAVLADMRGARLFAGLLAVVAGGLAALGAVLAMANLPVDQVLATALTLVTLVFGVSAILLLRPAR